MARIFAGERLLLLEEFANGVTDEQLRDLPKLKVLIDERKEMVNHIKLMHLFLEGISWSHVEQCINNGVKFRHLLEGGIAVIRYNGWWNVFSNRMMPAVMLRFKDE